MVSVEVGAILLWYARAHSRRLLLGAQLPLSVCVPALGL